MPHFAAIFIIISMPCPASCLMLRYAGVAMMLLRCYCLLFFAAPRYDVAVTDAEMPLTPLLLIRHIRRCLPPLMPDRCHY